MTQTSSVQNTSHKTEALRPDQQAQILQRRAADPAGSAWVEASAGTGKTKVLTDRVLRLLLPRSARQAGTPPHKILCLTFTKAGANEMALRVGTILRKWAACSQEKLQDELHSLLGRAPQDFEKKAARRLFTHVIDSAGGLQILTIHSFCQSVLGRFPLESGLIPGFRVIEDAESKLLLKRARDDVIATIRTTPSHPAAQALQRLAQEQNEEQIATLLTGIAAERQQLTRILDTHFGAEGLYTALCSEIGVRPEKTPEEYYRDYCLSPPFSDNEIAYLTKASAGGNKKDQPLADACQQWLEASPDQRISSLDDFKSAFLTGKNTIRLGLPTKDVVTAYPESDIIFHTVAESLLALQDRCNAAICAFMTRDLIIFSETVLARYQSLKNALGGLDFDDLISRTLYLLGQQDMTGWVMYKLDRGLDHILIDEAQDTNPEQWSIIQALCTDFFSGQGRFETQSGEEDGPRTIFTVGDKKQSIYSFQRAAPEEMDRMQTWFAEKIEATQQVWNPVKLYISFRSAPAVLRVVDAVFTDPVLQDALGGNAVHHDAHRTAQEGCVTLWPLFEPDKDTEESNDNDGWTLPIEIKDSVKAPGKMAEHIGSMIRSWLDEGKSLESHDRPIRAGDIMILVKSRNAFVNQLIRALKIRNIPVSGIDRMVVSEQLVVEDCLVLAQFCLYPDNDLTLATLLKTPLIGLDDNDLIDLAPSRSGSLWTALQQSKDDRYRDVIRYLKDCMNAAQTHRPYAFFSRALYTPCPGDGLSGLRAILGRLGEDALDPLQEFLNQALTFERQNIPSLQLFVHHCRQQKTEIKRDMEDHSNRVRIMTVHGSKGLQAPIVILPDTIRIAAGRKNERLLWPNRSSFHLPLWSPRKNYDPAFYQNHSRHVEDYLDQEYQRLLYVAMTRAENHLHILGARSSKPPLPDSWYFSIQRAMTSMGRAVTDGHGCLVISNPQEGPPDKARPLQESTHSTTATPTWLTHHAPAEPSPPNPLVPSRPADPEPAALSPRQKRDDRTRFERGNLVHKLLQILPDLGDRDKEKAAQRFLTRYAPARTDHAVITNEVMAILNDPAFAPIFTDQAMAEVPLSQLSDDATIISGQIDRLLIREDGIWIIDYKTNRPPPDNADSVPSIYRYQMRAYKNILQAIYPHRPVHCALLWTYTATLMPLDV